MDIKSENLGPITLLRVRTERIDAAVAIQFKDQFRDLVRGGTGNVVLDLSDVTFLDSSGLGAVVAARKILGAERELELSCLSPAVEKVMTLTRMNLVFSIHPSVDDALSTHGIAPAA